jgi:hypothetical protein
MDTNYQQKYIKYKSKYLKLKELSGGTGPIDEYIENMVNKLFGKKPEVKPEVIQEVKPEVKPENYSNILYDENKALVKKIKKIKKYTEIESETEGFEHGQH